jgi:hypothetical protein
VIFLAVDFDPGGARRQSLSRPGRTAQHPLRGSCGESQIMREAPSAQRFLVLSDEFARSVVVLRRRAEASGGS